MPEIYLSVRGCDPLIFRDARPFSTEAGASSAQSLSVPLSSTLAGMVRTRIGNLLNWDWMDRAVQEMARAITVYGPIMACNDVPHFPMPADSLIYTDESENLQRMTLRPELPTGYGCDLPDADKGLIPLHVTADGKPESDYGWWGVSHLADWLASKDGIGCSMPPKRRGLAREGRVHVGIDPNTGCSEEGKLFSTQAVTFEQYTSWDDDSAITNDTRWTIQLRVIMESELKINLEGLAPLGGERRLAAIKSLNQWIASPANIANALQGATRVRWYLATPAVFASGWKPDFLNSDLEGTVPRTKVTVRLKSAAVKRREALSGWDYRHQMLGPKPVRWTVPAGSVYFFEVIDGDPTELSKIWLEAIDTNLDDGQPARDGFGLGMWGIW